MTTFMLTAANDQITLRVDVKAMLEAGELKAYRVRSNGTVRRMSLYPLGSTQRETAEYVSDRVDMDGASVQAVARELHVSTAAVRRIMLSLELTEEIEEGEWNGIWTAYESDSAEIGPETVTSPEAKAEVAGAVTVTLADNAVTYGDECEPTGTTAEELVDALAESIAQTNPTKARETAANALHVQLNDQGELEGVPTIPRRSRSHG